MALMGALVDWWQQLAEPQCHCHHHLAAGAGGEELRASPWGQPGIDSKDFDSAFDAWFKRMSEQ